VILSHNKKIVSGKEGLIGEIGHADTTLLPQKEGKVFVHGELWNAMADEHIRKDEKIVVVKAEGLTLKVKKA
jgi:membrane-bound serine protease (ClpP class)